MTRILLDTGPLVAFLNARDRHHRWARELLSSMPPPLYTCQPVLSEACFLVRDLDGGPDAVLALVTRGVVDASFTIGAELPQLRQLMQKYASVPMSLADACLVRMAEQHRDAAVLTVDSDFRIYRKHRRQRVPTLMPD